MGIMSHAHLCIYWWIIHSASLQNVSNKPMKFHDDNQNNTQYIRVLNSTQYPEFFIRKPGAARSVAWVYLLSPYNAMLSNDNIPGISELDNVV